MDRGPEREALQKFSMFFQANPSAMVISALPERTIVDVNDAFTEKLGYTGRRLAERRCWTSGCTRIAGSWSASAAHRRSGLDENEEVDIRGKDGTLLRSLFSGKP
jgi:PAS domain-containing protein